MCSILGGTSFDEKALQIIEKSKDRGRDYFGLSKMGDFWIGNHRATPTNEIEHAVNNQPFGKSWKIVHNGTISNDEELGGKDGDIDSAVLADVLDFTGVVSLSKSLEKIRGSFAIAATNGTAIYLACNYKPIFYRFINGELYFSSLNSHLDGKGIRVEPYTVLNPLSGEWCDIPRIQFNSAVVVCSAGLDSSTCLQLAKDNHEKVEILHFKYGCRAEEREMEMIHQLGEWYDMKVNIIPMDFKSFAGRSTLFSDEEIDSGKAGVEYALDWVPARNLVMLSLAVAFAESNDFGFIYLGTNLEEAGAFPDNEEQFLIDFNKILYGAVQNGLKVEIKTPLGGLMKKEIVQLGAENMVPYELTWSCYNGNENHCGNCAPCYMRKLAFQRAEIPDPTIYKENSNE